MRDFVWNENKFKVSCAILRLVDVDCIYYYVHTGGYSRESNLNVGY